MDSVGISSLDFQYADHTTVSLTERRSFVHNFGASCSIITIDDAIPSLNWKLHEILPSKAYKMNWWKYKSNKQIKVSSLDITFTD